MSVAKHELEQQAIDPIAAVWVADATQVVALASKPSVTADDLRLIRESGTRLLGVLNAELSPEDFEKATEAARLIVESGKWR